MQTVVDVVLLVVVDVVDDVLVVELVVVEVVELDDVLVDVDDVDVELVVDVDVDEDVLVVELDEVELLVEVVDVATQTDGSPVHWKPASTRQTEEQPSPAVVFPSSQPSGPPTTPSPQIV